MNKFAVLMAVCAAFGMAGCGGGGGGGPSSQAIPSTPPAFTNLSGTWEVSETLTDNCPDPNFATYDMYATQNGAGISVQDQQGRNYSGTMAGSQIFPQVPFSYPEQGGITTVTQLNMNVLNQYEMEGNSVWSWSNGIESCSGTSTFYAYKKP